MNTPRRLCALAVISTFLTACPVTAFQGQDPQAQATAQAEAQGATAVQIGAPMAPIRVALRGTTTQPAALPCDGFVASNPDRLIDVIVPRTLRFETFDATGGAGNADGEAADGEAADGADNRAQVQLRGPDGTVYCSQAGVLRQTLSQGQWQLWFRSTRPAEHAAFSLNIVPDDTPTITTLGGTLPPRVTTGEAAATTTRGTYGGLIFAEGSAAATLRGQGGGPRDARTLGEGCVGYIAMTPDHIVDLEALMELTLAVESEADTSLVVIGPAEIMLCDDDTVGLQPALRRTLTPGAWAVHVGSRREGAHPNYTLTVSR